ncbi:MAG TPA: oligosaccharide flippase family protein [Chitinophagaceae bacterium]|nr:oligosaccharide flippase family protein [Chitinophagaceae bacterium]
MSVKKLAGQTFWYGLSSILGRFLNYLLTPLLATLFASAAYGRISLLFAIAAFLNVIFSYGQETSYFRFASQHDERKVYNTSSTSLLFTTILLTAGLLMFAGDIAAFLEIPEHPDWVTGIILIVALDTLCVMPFAKLRYQGRPRKFAFVRILNIGINIALVVFFLVVCRKAYESGQQNFFASLYDPRIGLGYVILANLAASALTLVLLFREFIAFNLRLNPLFWKKMMSYSWPLIIVGLGGMVNEMIDRFMILKLYPGNTEEAYSQAGIYSANYKLAIIIVLFIQAFRLGAEPFFFRQSGEQNAAATYARIMKFFVLACCFCFLGVVLFLDIWKYFMGTRHPEYYTGLKVVPLLMLAKIFLGVYYNLSIWYKLTDRTLLGAWITLGGAAITVLVNWMLIPVWGYMGSAVATVLCYGFMMVMSYTLGQKHYPVPYPVKKLVAYVALVLMLFGVHQALLYLYGERWFGLATGGLLLLFFAFFVLQIEKKELRRLWSPGKLTQPPAAESVSKA